MHNIYGANYMYGAGGGGNNYQNQNQQQNQQQQTGKISEWAFKQGYWCGFVIPDNGGQRVFVDGRDYSGKLFKGDSISFRITQGLRGIKAVDVQKLQNKLRVPPYHQYQQDDMKAGVAGVVYFQTEFYDKQQMSMIEKKFGTDYARGPKILFGDNYADKFRKYGAKRNLFGGQSQVMGHYDKSYGFGIPTAFDKAHMFGFNYSTQNFDVLMTKLFTELQSHLRKGGDIIIPYPSVKDLKNRPEKYFKSKYLGFAKTNQLIFHNLGTGNAPLNMDALLIIQKHINKLKKMASRTEIVNQVLYNNYNNTRAGIYNKNSSNGGIFYQTQWYTREQMHHIENKYKLNKPRMLFDDNDIDKKRWSATTNRSYCSGMAGVMGKYDTSYAYGITTQFKGGYIPDLNRFKSIMNSEFLALKHDIMSGCDIVIPAPSRKQIERDRHKYFSHGKQEIFHNLGVGSLAYDYVFYLNYKIDELKSFAKCIKTVDFYDFNVVPTVKKQLQAQTGQQWECKHCYKFNPDQRRSCSNCGEKLKNEESEKANINLSKWRNFGKENSDVELDEDEQRKSWNIGSEIEVNVGATWFKGKIIEIDNDMKGEILVIQYMDPDNNNQINKQPIFDRFGVDIRPISKSKSQNQNQELEIDIDSLNIDSPQEILNRYLEQNRKLEVALDREKLNHEHLLKEEALKHVAEKHRLRNILNGKELKIAGLENKLSLHEIEREKQKFKQKAAHELAAMEQKVADMAQKYNTFLDESGITVCWEWKEDDNSWKQFDDFSMKELENIKTKQWKNICIQGQFYRINRTSKDVAIQTNINTNVRRDCRRRIVVAQQVTWEWQENNGKWIQYSDDIAKNLEELSNGEKYSYIFPQNSQSYEITRQALNFGVQINTKTKVSRAVRRIKSGDDGANIYPHFWDLSKIKKYDQAEIVEVKLTDTFALDVIKKFVKTASDKKIVKLEAIMNQRLYDKYTHEKDALLKLKGGDATKINEKELYHGTKNDATVDVIKSQGFRKEFTSVAYFGEGTYFARDASYSVNYSSPLSDGKTFRMFVCKVLCGESRKGAKQITLKTWPLIGNHVCDSLVNDTANPTIFVIHDDSRVYPMWCVYFQAK